MLTKLFRDFKRYFNKARNIAENLGELGEFKFQVKSDGVKTVASNQTPDNKETMRFVVIMRHFLAPDSNLYYAKIWSTLSKEFSQEIPLELKNKIENTILEINRGQFSISIDGKDFTAEDIYKTISEGGFFENQEKVREYLSKLSKAPLVGPMFWFQFYSYSLNALNLIANLFQVILLAEKSDKYKAVYGEKILAEPKCIYCLQTTGKFNSEEHIFPESLGNDELVLPKGYVCDRCNNGVLAQLDEVLIKFEPIAFLQVQMVPHTKNGSLPKANFQNMSMERTSPNHIKIVAKDKSGEIQNKTPLGDDWYSFSVNMRGRPFTQKFVRILGRALFKIALGLVALSQGHEQALDERFNKARKFILGESDFKNNYLIKLKGKPHPNVMIAYKDFGENEGVGFEINIMGIVFLLNLEEMPMLEFNETIRSEDFGLYSLSGYVNLPILVPVERRKIRHVG